MKKSNILRKCNISPIVAFLLTTSMFTNASLFPSSAQAESAFVVQLGGFASEKEADAHWSELNKRFPDLFSGVNYLPTEVKYPNGKKTLHRVQAGPMSNQAQADKICTQVQTSGFECYVGETALLNKTKIVEAEKNTEKNTEQNSAVTIPLPVEAAQNSEAEKQMEQALNEAQNARPQAKENPQVQEVPKFKDVAEITSAKEEAKKPLTITPKTVEIPASNLKNTTEKSASPFVSPAPLVSSDALTGAPSAKAQVNIAEAVPVPLSSDSANNDGSRASYSGSSSARATSNYAAQGAGSGNFWAELSYFNSNADAYNYWNSIKERSGNNLDNLDLRVVQPFRKYRTAPRYSLRVGPFPTLLAIRQLCADTRNEKLLCRAVKQTSSNRHRTASLKAGRIGTGARNFFSTLPQNSIDGDSAAELPQGRYASISRQPKPANLGSGYWLQLGSFPNAGLAARAWQMLQDNHKNILGNLSEQITTPNGSNLSNARYRLRTGPFNSNSAAMNICSRLQAGGGSCIVISGN